MSNPETLRYLAWTTQTVEEAEGWVAGQSVVSFPQSDQDGYLAIETLETPHLIGLATVWFPYHAFDLAQFEVIIHPDSQRNGYGTEAVRGILAYIFKGVRVRRITAKCDARNLAGRRLLLKAGLRQESECIQDRFRKSEWVNTVGFALLKQEYETQFQGPK